MFQLRPVPSSQRAVSVNYDVSYRGDEPVSTNAQRASYSVSATLPAGVTPAYGATAAPGQAATTLERESRPLPPKGSKPMTAAQLAASVQDAEHHEKEKKHKSRFSFFGSKSKKDKDGKK